MTGFLRVSNSLIRVRDISAIVAGPRPTLHLRGGQTVDLGPADLATILGRLGYPATYLDLPENGTDSPEDDLEQARRLAGGPISPVESVEYRPDIQFLGHIESIIVGLEPASGDDEDSIHQPTYGGES